MSQNTVNVLSQAETNLIHALRSATKQINQIGTSDLESAMQEYARAASAAKDRLECAAKDMADVREGAELFALALANDIANMLPPSRAEEARGETTTQAEQREAARANGNGRAKKGKGSKRRGAL